MTSPTPENTGRRPAVLIVDDDRERLATTVRLLDDGTVDILSCADPADAITIAAGRALDLVLTRLVLPRISGVRLAEQLRALAPAIPVLFLTDHVGPPALGGPTAGLEILSRPAAGPALVRKVRSLLKRP